MKVLEVKYEMKLKSDRGEWYEELEEWNGEPKPTNEISAKKQAVEIVEFFNAGLREGEKSRKLIGIRKTEKLERVTEIEI